MVGVLLIDKPLGLTSHDVVDEVRRRLGTRRVGHAGSLDPMATGVLVVAVGPATRFLQYLPLEPKEYDAEFRFGQETDTQDAEGSVVAEAPVPGDLTALVERALPTFVGAIEQVPPMYSAVKRGGRPLYALARQGVEVEREPRRVFVDRFERRSDGNPMRFRIVCSGGTYVRTLAHDLGRAVGCGAHLSSLRRTRVGRFTLSETIPLERVDPTRLLPLEEALPPMPLVRLTADEEEKARLGRSLPRTAPAGSRHVGLLDTHGRAFAVARVVGGTLHPECVIPREVMLGPI